MNQKMFEIERCFSLGYLRMFCQESKFILFARLIRAEYEREKQEYVSPPPWRSLSSTAAVLQPGSGRAEGRPPPLPSLPVMHRSRREHACV